MKPNSSMLKLAAAVLLATGLAACENEGPGGEGDTDLYGPETQQMDPAQPGSPDGVVPNTTPQQTAPGTYETQPPGAQTPQNNMQQPAGEGDPDLYGTPPNQNVPDQNMPDQSVPGDSPYETGTGTDGTSTDDTELPTRP